MRWRICCLPSSGPDDAVVSPNPAYPIHQYGVIMAEGHACMLPMPDPATFLNGLEHLYNTSSRKPKMILISFPHNPTTQCVDLQFFRDIVQMAARHGTVIVHDFAYADICFDGYKAPSILEVEGAKEIAVEIYSLSKSFNMAGWRVGFCLGNRKLIGALARIKSYLDYGIFQPIQIASIIALRECGGATKKICATYQERRDVLVKGLKRAGWPVEPPRGSMFVWAPIPERHRATRIARIRETAHGKSAGGRIARHRVRTSRRRPRSIRVSGERASHQASHEIDPAVSEEVISPAW